MIISFKGDTGAILPGAEALAEELHVTFSGEGYPVTVRQRDGADLTVEADGQGAVIVYDKKHHFFRALSLLCQHLCAGEEIFSLTEKPRFDSCGPMFDVSQGNAVIRPAEVKKLLRMMAQMGLNTLMLYCEDSFEVKSQPYFGYMRPRYTEEELRQCDEYAALFGIEMIPCIQTLAHLVDVLKWGVYDDIRENDVCLLVGEEKTYRFIRDLITAASRPFRSKRIHIGMDEAYLLGRGAYFDRHGPVPTARIMQQHLEKVLEIVREMGLSPMMWSDMFFHGYDYYGEEMLPREVAACVPKDVELVYWDYYHNDEHAYEVDLERHRPLGKTAFAGGIWTWIGPGLHWKRTFLSTQAALNVCKRRGVREVFVTVWGDNGTEAFYTANLPGLALYAEHAYADELDEAKLRERFEFVTGARYDDFLALEGLDAVPGVTEEQVASGSCNPSKYLLWQDLLTGLMDKNVEGLPLNAHYAALSEKLRPMEARNGAWGPLFGFSRRVADVLAVKAELGLRITAAYRSGDREGLAQLADGELPELYRRMSDLRTYHRTHWFRMYKALGWDVMDMRYGSLLARIDSAMAELHAYLSGETERLEELEEERLDYNGKAGVPDYVNWFGRIVSPSRIAPYC